MIKTLQIASIIVAVLAGVFLVFPAVFAIRSDEKVDMFLNLPSAIENFKTQKGKKSTTSSNQVPPLVKQAKAFALYLNPPEPKKPPQTSSRDKDKKPTINIPRPQNQVSSKFELIGTAYYQSRPESSMALINEPGKGLTWIRQGEEVNHLIFEQIRDGLVVIRDGKQTRELRTPQRAEDKRFLQFVNLEKAASEAASRATSYSKAAGRPASKPALYISSEEEKEISEKFEALISQFSGSDEEDARKEELIEEFFSSITSERIDGKEADKLRELGKNLDKARGSSVRDSNSTKIISPRRKRPPSRRPPRR
ncbi:hypothetical protein ACFL1G_04090 [Planctomycetota bacterium]